MELRHNTGQTEYRVFRDRNRYRVSNHFTTDAKRHKILLKRHSKITDFSHFPSIFNMRNWLNRIVKPDDKKHLPRNELKSDHPKHRNIFMSLSSHCSTKRLSSYGENQSQNFQETDVAQSATETKAQLQFPNVIEISSQKIKSKSSKKEEMKRKKTKEKSNTNTGNTIESLKIHRKQKPFQKLRDWWVTAVKEAEENRRVNKRIRKIRENEKIAEKLAKKIAKADYENLEWIRLRNDLLREKRRWGTTKDVRLAKLLGIEVPNDNTEFKGDTKAKEEESIRLTDLSLPSEVRDEKITLSAQQKRVIHVNVGTTTHKPKIKKLLSSSSDERSNRSRYSSMGPPTHGRVFLTEKESPNEGEADGDSSLVSTRASRSTDEQRRGKTLVSRDDSNEQSNQIFDKKKCQRVRHRQKAKRFRSSSSSSSSSTDKVKRKKIPSRLRREAQTMQGRNQTSDWNLRLRETKIPRMKARSSSSSSSAQRTRVPPRLKRMRQSQLRRKSGAPPGDRPQAAKQLPKQNKISHKVKAAGLKRNSKRTRSSSSSSSSSEEVRRKMPPGTSRERQSQMRRRRPSTKQVSRRNRIDPKGEAQRRRKPKRMRSSSSSSEGSERRRKMPARSRRTSQALKDGRKHATALTSDQSTISESRQSNVSSDRLISSPKLDVKTRRESSSVSSSFCSPKRPCRKKDLHGKQKRRRRREKQKAQVVSIHKRDLCEDEGDLGVRRISQEEKNEILARKNLVAKMTQTEELFDSAMQTSNCTQVMVSNDAEIIRVKKSDRPLLTTSSSADDKPGRNCQGPVSLHPFEYPLTPLEEEGGDQVKSVSSSVSVNASMSTAPAFDNRPELRQKEPDATSLPSMASPPDLQSSVKSRPLMSLTLGDTHEATVSVRNSPDGGLHSIISASPVGGPPSLLADISLFGVHSPLVVLTPKDGQSLQESRSQVVHPMKTPLQIGAIKISSKTALRSSRPLEYQSSFRSDVNFIKAIQNVNDPNSRMDDSSRQKEFVELKPARAKEPPQLGTLFSGEKRILTREEIRGDFSVMSDDFEQEESPKIKNYMRESDTLRETAGNAPGPSDQALKSKTISFDPCEGDNFSTSSCQGFSPPSNCCYDCGCSSEGSCSSGNCCSCTSSCCSC